MSPRTPPPAYPSPERLHRRPPTAHRSWSAPLGRVAGVRITVHASFLVLVALVALGATAPGQPAVIVQVAWVVILFACVVAHELAHSLVARAHGVPVKEIELLPIGGLSKLESQPSSARVELLIAAAGPAMSLAIGGTIAALAAALGTSPWPIGIYDGPLVVRVVWVNVLLALFNLLPALPLDGGRVLRAALTPRLGRERATRIAARGGRGAGFVLIAVGLIGNVWLLVIGVFILLGALSEEAAAAIEQLLAGVRVGDLPLHTDRTLPADAARADVDDLVTGTPLLTGAPSIVVLRHGTPIGVAEADDVEALARQLARAGRGQRRRAAPRTSTR